MKLEDIGFYTLEDNRAKNASHKSPLWRCELLLTSKCNFNCAYCRKRTEPDIKLQDAIKLIDYWASEGLRNIRFSGGEPTMYPYIFEIVEHAEHRDINRIALSTNGSASKKFYKELIDIGVNDFSISLDACCASTGDSIAGIKQWEHVVKIIEYVSQYVYTTVGVVVTEKNIEELPKTIELAKNLGVHDIRIISAAQWNKPLEISKLTRWQFPILNYRITNIEKSRHVRGMKPTDNPKCPLVLDDMAVEGKYHYPCIIYLRERGNPIGKIEGSVREDRLKWYKNHNCLNDKICKNNCLDVCVDYNNKVKDLQGE